VELRDLPSVDELTRGVDDPLAVEAARTVLERAREEIRAGAEPGDLAARLHGELRSLRAPSLRRVLNATGVLVHTNLGRAPLAAEALAQVVETGRGYSNLELDLSSGSRGSRQDHVASLLRRLTGAEAALVVNNNAAAMLLALAARHGLPLVDDLGSGVLDPIPGEPTARDSPADLVCFSGDKLLGGPQAGIVVGRAELVERLRRHPLQRALRADKLSLAALEGTLRLYLDAPERIPVLRMLHQDAPTVRVRAERLAALTAGTVEETVGRVGGGALPLAELPSFACALDESLAAPLRGGDPPVLGIVRDGKLLLDCLALADDDVDEVAHAVAACR
jgi:L-seryl-tRNA(Ser) seleniumtransferase